MTHRVPRRNDPLSDEEWDAEVVSLALAYAPNFIRCVWCQLPVHEGHCCDNCGDTNPGGCK